MPARSNTPRESAAELPSPPVSPRASRGAAGIGLQDGSGPILGGGSPRVLLARLVDGDPLGIRARVGKHLRREALFLDVDRVTLRALTLCALEAARAPGPGDPGARAGDLAAWLDERVDRATRAVQREDLTGPPVLPDGRESSSPSVARAPDVHDQIARALGLEPAATRAACTALNLRPAEERQALQAWLVERASLDAVASAFGVSASEIARRTRRALEAALAAASPHP